MKTINCKRAKGCTASAHGHWLAFIAIGACLTSGAAYAQTTIPATYALASSAADTGKPGFVWRIHQVGARQENSNARTELQLAGRLGPNTADPSAISIALGRGVGPDPATAPISFEIGTVINLNIWNWNSRGNFLPDDPVPGLPGTAYGTDYAAGELTTWLDLPQGTVTLGVNSDDGFRMTVGGPEPMDMVADMVGEFDGERGATDTLFSFYVPKAGLYASRCTWEQGVNEGNIELFSVRPDGTTVLINDRQAGGIPAYRAVTAAPRASVKSVSPAPHASGIALDAPIVLELADGGTPVDPTTITLSLNVENIAVTASRQGGVCTVTHLPSKPYSAGSLQRLTLGYVEATLPVIRDWSFRTIIALPTGSVLPSSAAVKSMPGFLWNVHQVDSSQPSNTERTERQLAGQLGVNIANRFVQSIALAPATELSSPTAPLKFQIPGVINLHGSYYDRSDNFPSDDAFPGLPGTTGSYENAAAEVLTWLELPVGTVTLGVNSDDGFRLRMGGRNPSDPAALTLGEFDGGRAAADTIFSVAVVRAGLYPMRCTWEQSIGAANLELFSVKADGTRVLVNDAANGGIPAYRAVLTLSPPSQTAEVGSEVKFSLQGHDSKLTYGWFCNGTNRIFSSAGPSLVLTNLQLAQAGAYTVVITNALGSATSAPAILNVVAPVTRASVPALVLGAPPAASVNLDYSPSLAPPDWRPLSTVILATNSEFYFDLSTSRPLAGQRYYRASSPGTAPGLNLHLVPAITLTGAFGNPVRLDYINQFGPTDAWVTLATVTLTNTSQLYFDTTAIDQPPRLYRLSNP